MYTQNVKSPNVKTLPAMPISLSRALSKTLPAREQGYGQGALLTKQLRHIPEK
jgi:hypothetical protein